MFEKFRRLFFCLLLAMRIALPAGFAYAEQSYGEAYILYPDDIVNSGSGTPLRAKWEVSEFDGFECVDVKPGYVRESSTNVVLQYTFYDESIDVAQYKYLVVDYYRTGETDGMNITVNTNYGGKKSYKYDMLNTNNCWHKTVVELSNAGEGEETLRWFQYSVFGAIADANAISDERFYIKSIGFYKSNPLSADELELNNQIQARFDASHEGFEGEIEEYADFSSLDGYERTGELLADGGFESTSAVTKSKETIENLIDDGSFESGAGKLAAAYKNGEITVTDGGYDGKKSLMVTNRTTNYSGLRYDIKDILAKNGPGTYRMSAYMRVDADSPSIGKLYYLASNIKGDGDEKLIWNGTTYKISDSWSKIEYIFAVSWNGEPTEAFIYTEGKESGDVEDYYIDALEFSKLADLNTDPSDTSWNVTSLTSELTPVSEDAYEGESCVKITGRTDMTSGVSQNIANVLNANGAGLYSVCAYVKNDVGASSAGKPYIIHVTVNDDSGKKIEKRVDYYITDEWHKIYFVFNLQWTGTVTSAYFNVEGYDSSDTEDFYVDGCSMFKYIQNDYADTHRKYVSGYGSGSFCPENSVTRAEAAQMTASLLADIGAIASSFNTSFADVQSGAWYRDSVAFLESIGALKMFDSYLFEPERFITRGEFASLVKCVNILDESEGDFSFADVEPADADYEDIIYAASCGIINGYDDGTFRPNAPVTRAEAVTMLNRAAGRFVSVGSYFGAKINAFDDVSEDYWAYNQIVEASNDHEADVFDKGGSRLESWKIDETSYDPDIKEKILKEVDEKAEALKSEILNAEDTLEVTGTEYYVSNSGSDDNSGLSPEEAWATPLKVSTFKFQPGDGVFFERGGVWYDASINCQSGVTYAAYGEGEKPKLFTSLKNFADPSLWKQTEIPNVWETVDEIYGTAGFVLFNDEIYSYKVATSEELKENYNFCDLSYGTSAVRIYYDGGNPGSAFESIMIAPGISTFILPGVSDVRIDNICMRYAGWNAVKASETTNCRITNCEVGWIGGAGTPGSSRWGNGIEFWGSSKNCGADHNWVYQIYDTALTNQYKGAYDIVSVADNITWSNNLVDYATFSFEIFSNQTNSNADIMKNIYIVNNISRYTGRGWGQNNRPAKNTSCHIKAWVSKNRNENVVIQNNIFLDGLLGTINAGSYPFNLNYKVYLVSLPQYTFKIDGNTYINRIGGSFSEYNKVTYTYDYDTHTEFIRDNVDKNAKIILLDGEGK